MREPAFLLMLLLAVAGGYSVSGLDSVAVQVSRTSILSHLLTAASRNQPVLVSTLFAFGISLLLSCFTGAAEIPRDISSGQIHFILSKPLSRTGYVLGKYVGIIVVCLAFFLVTEVSVLIGGYLSGGTWMPLPLFGRQLQMAVAFLPFTAIIIAFSCFFGDISAIILTVIYFMFSLLFNMLPILIAILPEGFAGEAENYLYLLYYLFPNCIYYFLEHRFAGVFSAALLVYSLSIAAVFLMIASYRINHIDLSRKE